MAKQTINNGESGLAVRNKLNNMFTELFDGAVTLTFTSEITGSGTSSIALTIASNVVTNSKLAKMVANTIKANANSTTENAQDIALSINQVLGRLSDNIEPIDLVTTTISVGDFTGDYSGLATETNWTDNFCSSATVAGSSGDFHFGVGDSGCSYYAYYGQSGWHRVYTDNRITDTTLIAELISTWTADTYNATIGDLGQIYIIGSYEYICIDGILHTWYRNLKVSATVTTTDISFLPAPQIEVRKVDNDTFTIAAKYDIISIIAENNDTTPGNISIGTADGLTDLVPSTALSVVATLDAGIELVYTPSANWTKDTLRTMYINIDSATAVTLHIVIQKKVN